jgi:hypothetical protein
MLRVSRVTKPPQESANFLIRRVEEEFSLGCAVSGTSVDFELRIPLRFFATLDSIFDLLRRVVREGR